MTRRVVKDPILAGQNRGEVEDKRAEKMGALDRFRRDNGHGGTRETIDGFATVTWRCAICGGRHKAPKVNPGGLSVRTCPHCGVKSEHERMR